MKKLGNTILIIAIAITVYFAFNFVPSRSVGGIKSFYEEDTRTLTIGRKVDKTKVGESVMFYIEEQAIKVDVIDNDLGIDENEAIVNLADGEIYKIIISKNVLTLGAILLATDLVITVTKRALKGNEPEDVV